LREILDVVLSAHPEMFPVIPGTRLSICKTNEFAGASFPDIPSLALYFHYDDEHVFLIAVDLHDSESYGF
jgi:hypothetical protein